MPVDKYSFSPLILYDLQLKKKKLYQIPHSYNQAYFLKNYLKMYYLTNTMQTKTLFFKSAISLKKILFSRKWSDSKQKLIKNDAQQY